MDSGIRIVGWHGELTDFASVTITRTVEALCNAFEIDARLPTVPEGVRAPILEGDQVLITYKGAPVLRGFCDSAETDDGPGESTCHLTGRSRASVVADSSCRLAGVVLDFPTLGITSHPSTFLGQRVEAIVTTVCAAFGVEVICSVDTGDPIPKLVIKPGDKAAEIVDGLCQRRGLLAYSDALGRVVLSRAADAAIDPPLLVPTRVRMTRDLGNSFVFTHVVGAQRGGAKVTGLATDLSWTPEDAARTLIIPEQNVSDQGAAQALALADRDARWGKATRVQVDLPGWEYTRSDNIPRPYRAGLFCSVDYPRRGLGEGQQWVASEVTSVYTPEGGHKSSMSLCYPEALQLQSQRDGKSTGTRGVAKGQAALAPWAQQVVDSPTFQAVVDGTWGAIRHAANNVVQIVAGATRSPVLPPSGVSSSGCVDAGDNATRLLDGECSRATGEAW